ncbi:HLA class II histocompatibility antigen, DP alpha 1 chain-like [Puntigrus tetrazona]|uniref:HLA class II histocompatibility antigen, DP alpha 1 chain-like n=1 Tax=Puntigrus tetrazona TaxID=1606681 RepID=UPI001C88EFE8|nr:HLA class II histocompatibility antigen, DP alpha 1 chain-like [Puntigrus tetrazona]
MVLDRILTLTFVLSASAEIVHEYFGIHGCSETDGEDMHGLDEEEMWHADFNQKRGVLTLPDFAIPIEFYGFYEESVIEMTGCKSDVAFLTKMFKSPPPEMDAPQTSVYPKDDVELGVQNTLICHVTGFYPPSLSISWTKNNVNVTEGISLSQYRPRADGTFSIFSTFTFTPAEGDIYSCTVNHRALQSQHQTITWDVEVALPSVGPAVFCGVGLTLGMLGVAAGTFFLIKGNNCY